MPERGRFALCALSLAFFALAACAPPLTPAPTSPPGILFQDDFSSPDSGWDRYSGADAVTDYDNGRYLIGVNDTGVDVWGRPGLELDDLALEVETRYAGGPLNNEYGVACRFRQAGDGRASFYFFMISSDGYFALGKVVQNARTILSPEAGSFQPSDAIRQAPEAVNVLAAACIGDRFSLAVNGTLVGEFTDAELARGDAALIAGTYDEGGVRIHFDNFVARPPG
jgi:hypothetical protein